MKLFIMIIAILLTVAPWAQAATITLGFAWDPNTEPDIKEYEVFRNDVVPRVSVCKVQHPTTTCLNNNITVPDGSQGTLTFVAVARDTALNTSGDSNQVSWAYDYQPPIPPKTFRKVSIWQLLGSEALQMIAGEYDGMMKFT